MKKQGWFHTDQRPGDRSIEQQLCGLTYLLQVVHGKSVLDVGCAEGLLSLVMHNYGATRVHGVEIVRSHVDVATRLAGDASECTFEVADANIYVPRRRYDVVLMLAVLHKLRDPSAACRRLAEYCRDLCVVRLPPATAPVILDPRSNYRAHDIAHVMKDAGFLLERTAIGTYDEWIGYFRRG